MFTKGYTPWNKGISHVHKKSFRKGHIPWNTGLKNSQHPYWLGKKRSQETIDRISKTKIGTIPWNKGSKLSPLTEEHKQKLREKRSNQVLPVRNTKPERFVQSVLSVNGIKYETHKSIKLSNGRYHQVDLFIEPNICIEVDGTYWHSFPNIIERDRLIDDSLVSQGYRIVRMGEKNIINSTYDSINSMMKDINITLDGGCGI